MEDFISMNSFDVSIGDKTYKMFFDRRSARQFEEIGGNLSDMREKIFSSTDRLFYVGLRKFHPQISFAEAQELSDKAIDEYGIQEVYGALSDKFMEVFTQGENSSTGKSFLAAKKTART